MASHSNAASSCLPKSEGTLLVLARTRQVIREPDNRIRLTSNLQICSTSAAFCDTVITDKEQWSAIGWAIDFETCCPCKEVLVVQDGYVIAGSSFESYPRGDVNATFGLAHSINSGVTVVFTPSSRSARVELLGILESGSVIPFSGPAEYLPALPKAEEYIAVATNEWAQKFRKPLHRFPKTTPFSDIYSFEQTYDPHHYPGVTAQFLEQADVYHEKYTDHRRWTYLLSQALFRLRINESQRVSVLDVGSGSGNSVFPILGLLPKADVVATDISPQLLAILYRQLSPSDRRRVLAVAMDASEPVLTPGTFDLIIGAAILHHILNPSTTIAACYGALKPTGHAIFFEPFEIGYVLLRVLYERLVSEAARLGLSEAVVGVLKSIILDVKVRTGSDKSFDLYRELDDKWEFTHTYFEEQSRRLGFSRVTIYPLDPGPQQFSSQLKTHLRLCLGAGPEVVPDRAWEIVHDFEAHFSPASAPERALEACVILSK